MATATNDFTRGFFQFEPKFGTVIGRFLGCQLLLTLLVDFVFELHTLLIFLFDFALQNAQFVLPLGFFLRANNVRVMLVLRRFEASYRIHTSEHGLSLFQGFGVHEDLLLDRVGLFTVDLKEFLKILDLVFCSVQDQGQLLVQLLLLDDRTLVRLHFRVHGIDALQLQSRHRGLFASESSRGIACRFIVVALASRE